ncbi:nuclear transcription factor Y subunit B-1-like [Gastrolobium bilobum]|uniref:nuclear transcription factor Y subunit B-1-like n=1 Tax=Gastrolobium bilobum TaxID=150636 RepID=UPI002AB19AD3|nr:nuclear transcription factor Y subunit B-1-like [Gastrolobium bilobum]
MVDVPASPGGESGDHSPRPSFQEQERYLPKETVQECFSEFTSERAINARKKTYLNIDNDDLLWAMATLGFEDYIEPLKIYLAAYRETEDDTKGSAKGGDASAKKDFHPFLIKVS